MILRLRALLLDSNILCELPIHLCHNENLEILTFRDNIIREISDLSLFSY